MMRIAIAALLCTVTANAACTEEPLEIQVEDMTKLSFTGFIPSVNRIMNTGVGNMIKLKGYSREPAVTKGTDTIEITAGALCDDDDDEGVVGLASGAYSNYLSFGLPLVFGGLNSAVVGGALFLAMSGSGAHAQTAVECEAVPIEVDIFVDVEGGGMTGDVNALVMEAAQSGDFEVCPPESLYWKHHPSVYGGYEGCVGELGYYPCPQDSQSVGEEGGALQLKSPLNFVDGECVETGYTTENRTYWVLWGDPLDKYELNARTGLNPVVTFPFNRGPYPTYSQGEALGSSLDDSADARAMAKDLLVYIEAFTMEELDAFEVSMTEGAESGMVSIWGGKALEIAQTTCNRDIYVLTEVPAYGYSNGDAAQLANEQSSTFYNSSECLCFADDSCKEPTVTITSRGWLPLTDLPIELGGDNITYRADSTSDASPWFESMVFPENPSGKIKTPQLANANRRVCDGVYVWPMYFGMRDYKIPMDERPDCAAWSFSITKAYSASVRAGFIMYKSDPISNLESQVATISSLYSMTNGLYSEWSWYGQMQLWEMIMSKPMSDPTSWIGAYSEIMEEKWSLIIDGFMDCPVLTLTNPRAGAYAWFVYNQPYIGIQGDFVSSFFRDVLGIRTTTYNWGFRGANPADFYGDGYGVEDFTRLQLYRDITVYEEISRRAKIVCADPDAAIGDFISVNQWVAGQGTFSRRMTEGYEDVDERKRHLVEVIPDLNDRQLEYLASSHESSDAIDKAAASCAPDFSTNCLFNKVGTRFSDY